MKNQTNVLKKRIILIVLSVVALLAVMIGGYTFARLIGTGYGKSVIYSTEQHFSSNVLRAANTGNNALRNIVRCSSGSQPIVIMNFDPSNFAADEFDLRYEFRCYLSLNDADDQYTYSVRTPDVSTPIDISDSTKKSPFIYEGMLKGGERSTDNFEVFFNPKSGVDDSEVLPMASICVVAVPISPNFMSSDYLGATISKSNEQFSVQGYFELDGEKEINELIGFSYEIVTYGVTNDQELVQLEWNSDVLQFDRNNKLYALCQDDGSGHITLEYSPKLEGENVNIVFYRTQEWGSGYKKGEDGEYLTDEHGDYIPYEWDDSVTWAQIRSLVSVSTKVAP